MATHHHVLVTGGAGFVGSHFVDHLLLKGRRVVNLDALRYCADVRNVSLRDSPLYTFIRGDVGDADLLRRIIQKYAVKEIVHFAAQTHVDASFTDSNGDFVKDNVVALQVLLEVCRSHTALRRLVHISTDEVYGAVVEGAANEDARLHPSNPYAATKAAGELLVNSYQQCFGLRAVTIRPNNIYGPRQFPEKLIPRFCNALLRGEPMTVHGMGLSRRAFLYVDDAAAAVMRVLEHGRNGATYNIGADSELNVLDVAGKLSKLAGVLSPAIRHVEDRPCQDSRYSVDDTLIRGLGWAPRVGIDEGMRATWEWYREANTRLRLPIRALDRSSVVLVYGSEGWIGRQVTELLHRRGETVVPGRARVDDADALRAEIDDVSPSRVFSLVGRTHGPGFSTIDYLEQKGKLAENVRDNLYAPILLALICKEKKVHLTEMATGCIFEYDDAHQMPEENEQGSIEGFGETDRPNFFGSSYSVVKGFTDRLLGEFEDTTLTCRIRMPITSEEHPRNFITKIVGYERVCSIPNSMSVLDELLPLMIKMAFDGKTGIYNFTNPGVISHNEILSMYRAIVDPSFSWKNFNIEDQARVLAAGRSNNFLDTEKLEGQYAVKPIREAVEEALRKMATRRLIKWSP